MHDYRSKEDRGHATRRLAADGASLRLEEVAQLLGVSSNAMERWVCFGKRGVHLDAVRAGGNWFTSWAAVERFRDGTGRGKRLGELLKRVLGGAATSPSVAGTPARQSSLVPSRC